MKKLLSSLMLFGFAFGTAQLPALADFNVTFGQHDRNHDHRWNYSEFEHANKYYYHHHPEVTVVSSRDLHHHFQRLDTNHDGYISREQAEKYRHWD